LKLKETEDEKEWISLPRKYEPWFWIPISVACVPTFILEISTWWCASVFFSSSFRNPVRCDGTRRKNSWHYFLDTIISYSLANTWRRVFASVIGFKPIDCCSRRARIICIKSYIMTGGKNHGYARLLTMVWLIFRDSIGSRHTTIVRPFIVGMRIEYSRAMSNYCVCLRADIVRPFFVMLKLHQCQKAGRVVLLKFQSLHNSLERCVKLAPRCFVAKRFARKHWTVKCNITSFLVNRCQ